MNVTATEFKLNFGKYLRLVATEDIYITRNGKTVAKMVNPQVSPVSALRGLLADSGEILYDDKDAVREERMHEKFTHHD